MPENERTDLCRVRFFVGIRKGGKEGNAGAPEGRSARPGLRLAAPAAEQAPGDPAAQAQQPERLAGRQSEEIPEGQQQRRRPFDALGGEGLRQAVIPLRPEALTRPDVPAQPPEIVAGELLRREVEPTAQTASQPAQPPPPAPRAAPPSAGSGLAPPLPRRGPGPAAPPFPQAPNSSISSGSTTWTACHASSTTTASAGTACPA